MRDPVAPLAPLGPPSGPGLDGPSAHASDGRLVHRVRWQLIAWSAGSTLAVLVVLGAALYWAVAATLASASESLLRERANLVAGSAAAAPPIGGLPADGVGTIVVGGDAAQPGFAVGGTYAGTLAVIVPGEGAPAIVGPWTTEGTGTVTPGGGPPATGAGVIVGPVTAGGAVPGEPPDPAGLADAQGGRTVLRETTYGGNPVRVLSMPLPASAAGAAGAPAGVVQVVGDRTAEVRTLNALLMVLVVGGMVALAVSVLVGSLYATRALVPIRASLRRQREFAADTSHELRTPLAVIRAGVARIRQQPGARVAEVEPALASIDAEAARLGTIVDDLLALARTDAAAADLDLRTVDLGELAADALETLEPLATKRHIRLSLDVRPAFIVGDADRLRRLVTVLVDNAIRHGREGGSVAVVVRPGSLVVEDDGPGIPAEDRDRVFDRFYRGEGAAPGGSGLGLAIAAWIVERHGGSIRATGAASGGARFEVSLPITGSATGFMTPS